MAIGFGASGRYLRRTTGLPSSSTAITVAAWVKVTSVRASAYQYPIEVGNGTTNATKYLAIGYGAGVFQIVSDAGATDFTAGPTVGDWYFLALTCSGTGTNLIGYMLPVGGAAFTTRNTNGSSFTPAAIFLGNDSYDEWMNAHVGPAYVFDRVLTEAELLLLAQRTVPTVAGTMPTIWSSLTGTTDTVDYAGGAAWTVGGTLTTEHGPPVPWGGRSFVPPLVSAAAGINGALSATLGSLTSAATGTVALAGTLSKTLGALTSVATGTISSTNIDGTLAKTLGALTSTATGTVAIAGTTAKTLGALTVAAKGYHLESATVGGLLAVDATNPRYFSAGGAIKVLSGFHTWASLVDHGASYPPTAFDYTAYLDAAAAKGVNFVKLWAMESLRDWCDVSILFYPPVYERTGPGNAADGRSKVDLTKFNPVYMQRLRERAIEAGNRGMYVCVQLFQGWQITQKGYSAGSPGTYHPFNAANNINSIDGDTDNDGQVGETRDISWTAVFDLQKAYVRAVIDAVNDLDHVIYEISNEEDEVDNASGQTKVAWQHALIDYIHTYEAGKAKQHPVGMTVQYPAGSDSDLFASNAEWISPKDGSVVTSVTASDGSKVILWDTDHTVGLTDEHEWTWLAFCRGCSPLYMDEWDGALYGTDKRLLTANERIRANLGYVLDYAARLDLANTTPNGSLSSTGYALAKTTGIVQILAYQNASGAFTVNLTSFSGTFTVEWLRTSTGATQAGSDVSGGAVRTLTPPWAGEDVVAFLELTGITGALAKTLGSLTSAATGALALAGSASKTLGSLTGVATGTVAIVATATVTLGSLTRAATGTVVIVATASKTLGALTVASSATVAIVGTALVTLGALTSTATGESASGLTGATAATLGALTGTATGALALVGVTAATLASLTSTAVAALAVVGATDATLGTLTGTAAGALATGPGGSGAVMLGTLTGSAAATLALAGAQAATLGNLTGATTGALDLVAVSAAMLGALTSTATGALAGTGGGNAILGSLTGQATGVAVVIIAIVTGSVRGPKATGNIYGAKRTGNIGR